MSEIEKLKDALKAILQSNAKPVYGIGGKEIKGYTLYLPKKRYEKALKVISEMDRKELTRCTLKFG